MTETAQETKEAPKLGTPEYDAAKAAEFDKRTEEAAQAAKDQTIQPDKPQKPEGVPDKFWDAEKGEVNYAAWSKSTAELEAKLSKQSCPRASPLINPARLASRKRLPPRRWTPRA